jgi:hypothetical protein
LARWFDLPTSAASSVLLDPRAGSATKPFNLGTLAFILIAARQAPRRRRTQRFPVGRIVTPVRVENATDAAKSILIDALVDTRASHLVLPSAWKDRLGALTAFSRVELELANQETAIGEMCGPVKIQIDGFRAVFSEVLFVDMHPEDGSYEPSLGYIPLEQSQAAVDLVSHRLVRVKHLDLK